MTLTLGPRCWRINGLLAPSDYAYGGSVGVPLRGAPQPGLVVERLNRCR